MSRSVNLVVLTGNLGADPVVRAYATTDPDEKKVANISVATSRRNGDGHDEVTWHRIVLFGWMAETAERFIRKGSKVAIEGRIQHRKYEDDAGEDRISFEIVATNLVMQDRAPAAQTAEASDV